ncbi:MAG: transposase [Clostridiales bacterium]|nr:transposase [Clostridiales bacterium]MCF8021296.1 transposase [Clostridiales bacterium]
MCTILFVSTDFESNAVKLQLAMLAYNFNNWFRRLCLPEQMKPNRMETLRSKLIKILASFWLRL